MCRLAFIQQESRAVARKPRDAAAVLFDLKFADNIHYKFKSRPKLRKPGYTAPNIPAQNRMAQNVHSRSFKFQGHVFWSQWKGYKGLSNTEY